MKAPQDPKTKFWESLLTPSDEQRSRGWNTTRGSRKLRHKLKRRLPPSSCPPETMSPRPRSPKPLLPRTEDTRLTTPLVRLVCPVPRPTPAWTLPRPLSPLVTKVTSAVDGESSQRRGTGCSVRHIVINQIQTNKTTNKTTTVDCLV